MTALGLAVAIPAVLAYNAFVRRNRIWLARLEAFAHDLFTLVTVSEGNAPISATNQTTHSAERADPSLTSYDGENAQAISTNERS